MFKGARESLFHEGSVSSKSVPASKSLSRGFAGKGKMESRVETNW
jgi:hypothetical protein